MLEPTLKTCKKEGCGEQFLGTGEYCNYCTKDIESGIERVFRSKITHRYCSKCGQYYLLELESCPYCGATHL